jgi:hypothetical protein
VAGDEMQETEETGESPARVSREPDDPCENQEQGGNGKKDRQGGRQLSEVGMQDTAGKKREEGTADRGCEQKVHAEAGQGG